ncbi:hypothetical protein SNK03_13591 [Fusarium graminearum]
MKERDFTNRLARFIRCCLSTSCERNLISRLTARIMSLKEQLWFQPTSVSEYARRISSSATLNRPVTRFRRSEVTALYGDNTLYTNHTNHHFKDHCFVQMSCYVTDGEFNQWEYCGEPNPSRRAME